MATAAPSAHLIEITDAAELVGCSPSMLRKLEARGVIPPALRTSTGRRLFSSQDVDAIKAARQVAASRRRLAPA